MTQETPQPQSPEEVVAAQITSALEEAGLIEAGRAAKFCSSLAAGQLTSEDWHLEIDLATAPKGTGNE